MSTFKVEAVAIKEILPHPNADRLELAKVKGWQCVVPKGQYKPDDFVLYIPIDAILPEAVEAILFASDAKTKLSNHRVRTIKIRGAISQGMICDMDLFPAIRNLPCSEGDDLAKKLGITKYEPVDQITTRGGKQRTRKETNPNFFKYTEIENLKNYTNVFNEGEYVYITCKIHGINFRAGWVPAVADTWWKKVKQFFGKLEKWDFVYGSHNVQLQNGNPLNGDVAYESVYSKAVKKFNLKETIPYGEVMYGEIYGYGIQSNYTYGCKAGEFGLVVFDIMVKNEYQNTPFVKEWCDKHKLQMVPILYQGPFNLEMAKQLTIGNSVLCPSQKIREGVVIKPFAETMCYCGRKILKLISDEYLLKE